jgi:hypothetical protein
VKGETVVRVNNPRDRCTVRSDPAQGPRLQIAARGDRGAQRWLQDDLKAGGGGLVKQMVPAAGDDRGLELTWIERHRSTEREYAGPALQPCDEGHHP